jgi:hypothetical protein
VAITVTLQPSSGTPVLLSQRKDELPTWAMTAEFAKYSLRTAARWPDAYCDLDSPARQPYVVPGR